MPKLTWMKRSKPKVCYLAALFSAYRKATGITAAQVAEELGCSPENARCQMCKPGKQWNVGQLIRYCDVLGIPYQEALEAIVKEVKA